MRKDPRDAFVNCNQSFMAGTGCSLAAGHEGPHGTICQACGEDWYEQGHCKCDVRCFHVGCNGIVADPEYDLWCEDHTCFADVPTDPDYLCNGVKGHRGEHAFRNHAIAPTEEELAEVYRSLGAAPPNR